LKLAVGCNAKVNIITVLSLDPVLMLFTRDAIHKAVGVPEYNELHTVIIWTQWGRLHARTHKGFCTV